MSRPYLCLHVAFAALLLVGGCHSTLEADFADGGDDGSAEIDGGDDVDLLAADLTPCTPKVDCTGFCGPIFDSCLGKNKQCGACTTPGQVCNLVSHVCEAPKTTCAALNAQCGTIRNSCGTRLAGPDCASNKEGATETNSCVNCQNVTCEQMGKECGWAWLG